MPSIISQIATFWFWGYRVLVLVYVACNMINPDYGNALNNLLRLKTQALWLTFFAYVRCLERAIRNYLKTFVSFLVCPFVSMLGEDNLVLKILSYVLYVL